MVVKLNTIEVLDEITSIVKVVPMTDSEDGLKDSRGEMYYKLGSSLRERVSLGTITKSKSDGDNVYVDIDLEKDIPNGYEIYCQIY